MNQKIFSHQYHRLYNRQYQHCHNPKYYLYSHFLLHVSQMKYLIFSIYYLLLCNLFLYFLCYLILIHQQVPYFPNYFFYFLFFFPKIDDFFSVQGFTSFFIDNSLCDYERASGLYYLMVLLFTALFLSTSTVSFSVLNCGFQEIFRNIFRNNSVSFFDDFKAGIKKNFKQGIGATLISWVVSAIIFFALGFYRNSFGKIGTLFFVLMMIVYLVFQDVNLFDFLKRIL